MITGDPEKDFRTFLAEQYFSSMHKIRVLSVGCGDCTKEIQWAKLLDIKQIECIDISPARIERAKQNVQRAGLSEIFSFTVGNVLKINPGKDKYDLVLAEQVLHHFYPLRDGVLKLKRAIKPGGILLANEYVGPDRFQWTPRQAELVNALLKIIPAEYRILEGTRAVKTKIYRPGKLAMWLNDPSEAAESSRISGMLEHNFELVAKHGYGGALLHPLMRGIAHNFVPETEKVHKILDLCFAVEDFAMAMGEIGHDFMIFVARKPV